MKYPELIKSARKMLKLSQVELAKQLSVSRVTLATWETGKHQPAYDIYRQILKLVLNQVKDYDVEVYHHSMILALRDLLDDSSKDTYSIALDRVVSFVNTSQERQAFVNEAVKRLRG